MQDTDYRDFQARLMPDINRENIIGVRTPELRAYAKKLAKTTDADVFVSSLPHKYYEENNLHAFIIERINDFDACVCALDTFLNYVDNWATCDMLRPKVFDKYPQRLAMQAKKWIASDKTYTIRYGIGMYLKLLDTDCYDIAQAEEVASVCSDEYYVNMMRAWYFATALAFHYEDILHYIDCRCLDRFTHNKTIQKAIESYRITPEQKAHLRTLKIK